MAEWSYLKESQDLLYSGVSFSGHGGGLQATEIGRTFSRSSTCWSRADEQTGKDLYIIVSYSFWKAEPATSPPGPLGPHSGHKVFDRFRTTMPTLMFFLFYILLSLPTPA